MLCDQLNQSKGKQDARHRGGKSRPLREVFEHLCIPVAMEKLEGPAS